MASLEDENEKGLVIMNLIFTENICALLKENFNKLGLESDNNIKIIRDLVGENIKLSGVLRVEETRGIMTKIGKYRIRVEFCILDDLSNGYIRKKHLRDHWSQIGVIGSLGKLRQ